MVGKIIIFGDTTRVFMAEDFFRQYGIDVDTVLLNDICDKSYAGRENVTVLSQAGDWRFLNKSDNYFILAPENPALNNQVINKLVESGIGPEHIFPDSIIYSSWMNELLKTVSFRDKALAGDFLNYLLANKPVETINDTVIINILSRYLCRKISNDLIAGQKTLAVYYSDRAYRSNLGSNKMYEAIRRQGYNVIFLFGVICKDDFEKRPFSYYAGHDLIEQFDFVDVFIVPTLMLGLPKKAKKVLFVHDIYDSPRGEEYDSFYLPDGKVKRESYFLSQIDYIFASSPTILPKSSKGYPYRDKPLCYIPGGYMKLDNNINYFQNSSIAVDSVIYAPTIFRNSFMDYVSLPNYGQAIIDLLLSSLPGFKIIFRPHPHTLNTSYVTEIVNKFSSNNRFVFDSNPSFYMDNYCRSKLMVTDISGTAFTYAFTTLRPVVFFSHNENTAAESFGNVQYFNSRERIGCIARNIDELKKKVLQLLDQGDCFKEQIEQFRNNSIYNVGRSEEYFSGNIHHIAQDRKNKHWIYIETPPQLKQMALQEDVELQKDELVNLTKILCKQKEQISHLELINTQKDSLIDKSLCSQEGKVPPEVRVDKQNEAVNSLKYEIQNRDRIISGLKTDINECHKTINTLQSGLLTKDETIASLKEDIAHQDKVVAELNVTVQEYGKKIDVLRMDISMRDNEIGKQKQELTYIKSKWYVRLFLPKPEQSKRGL